MVDPASRFSLPSFSDFLAYLRERGYEVGIDDYVRVQHLFEKIGFNNDPEKLKTLLCPLFARSRIEQKQFYGDFDNYVSHILKHKPPPQPPPYTPIQKKSDWYRFFVIISIGVIVLIGTLIIMNQRRNGPISNTNNSAESNADSDNRNLNSTGSTVTKSGGNRGSNANTNTNSNNNINTNISRNTDSQTGGGRWRLLYYIVAFALPLLMFLIFDLYQRLRRKQVLEQQHSKQPPYKWSLKPKFNSPALYNSSEFYQAVRLMRRRQVDEFNRIDIGATITATIKAGGYPSFRYKFASKAPEYLVLINRVSMRDHQARLYSELVKAFRHEQIFVVHYFYEDPLVCSDEADQQRIYLADLQGRYPTHRLLVFGNGYEMLDPFTGEMAEWTKVFQSWYERALLTPEPLAKWGLRELALAKQFIVLPATLQGLTFLIGQLETTLPSSLGSRLNDKTPPLIDEIYNIDSTQGPALIKNLIGHLGEEVFQWLCACAIYPELDWELTLYLGSLPCLSKELITEENLTKLIRLPWFRHGMIPDDVRWHLIQALDGEKLRCARLALINLLEKYKPEGRLKETYAADDYQINLLSQRWLYKRENSYLRELLAKIKSLPLSQALRDATLARFLQTTEGLFVNFILPRRLRQRFFIRGISSFGLHTSAKLALTSVFALILLSLVPFVPVPRVALNAGVSPTPQSSPPPQQVQTPDTSNSSNVNTSSPSNAAPPKTEGSMTVPPRITTNTPRSTQTPPDTRVPTPIIDGYREGTDNSFIATNAAIPHAPIETREFRNANCPILEITVRYLSDKQSSATVALRDFSKVDVSKDKLSNLLLEGSCLEIVRYLGLIVVTPIPAPVQTPTPKSSEVKIKSIDIIFITKGGVKNKGDIVIVVITQNGTPMGSGVAGGGEEWDENSEHIFTITEGIISSISLSNCKSLISSFRFEGESRIPLNIHVQVFGNLSDGTRVQFLLKTNTFSLMSHQSQQVQLQCPTKNE